MVGEITGGTSRPQRSDKFRNGRIWTAYFGSAIFMICLLSLEACAPPLYHVDLRYRPTGKLCQPASEKMGHYAVTVAGLNDVRKTEDKPLIGKVMNGSGGGIPILPEHTNVADSVSSNIRECLTRLGYGVATESPSWNLKEDTVHQGWGDMLVGGNIDELEAACEDSILHLKKTCRVHVKLSIVFASVPERRIFDRLTVRSSASLEDIFVSEKTIGQLTNAAFSDVVENIFCDSATADKIERAMKSSRPGI
jgi:hypothetical protein